MRRLCLTVPLDVALSRLRDEEPTAARDAAGAIEWMAGGQGLGGLDQHTLQEFLWYALPEKWLIDLDGHLAVVRSLARLFELLDMPRYATICRSDETAKILAAWAGGDGFDEFTAAVERSGVEPPNTDRLTWGGAMGVGEALARHEVARTLEMAIAAGELTPGARGWKQRRLALVNAALDRPAVDVQASSWLEAIHAERAERWLSGRNLDGSRQQILWADGIDVSKPADPPPDVASAIAPVTFLLQALEDGVELTTSGYLPRLLVVAIVERFGWQDPVSKPPRSEADAHLVMGLRNLATRTGAVHRRGRRLALTKKGKALAADAGALWDETIRAWPGSELEAASLEIASIITLTSQTPVLWRAVVTATAQRLSAEGWASGPDRTPVTGLGARGVLAHPLALAEGFGWIDRSWRTDTLTLSQTGRAAMLEFLHVQATAPWRGP